MLKSKIIITRSATSSEQLQDSNKRIENFKKNIYELKKLSVDELHRFNYTDSQIEAIKTYDDLEAKSVKAVTTVKFNVKKNQLSYDSKSGLSTVKATVNFTWNGSPQEWGRDCFAMTYEADNNHNFKKVTTVSSSLKYKEWKSATNVKTWTKSATKKGDQGVMDHMAGIFL